MRFVLSRLLGWLAALALLPACWAVTLALGRALPAALRPPGVGAYGNPSELGSLGALYGDTPLLAPEGWALIGGALLFGVWHRLRPPEFLSTFAHELTHLAFALLLGKKVSRFEVSRGSGQVVLSSTNPLITLAPYFFPLPAALVLAAGALVELTVGDARLRAATAFLTGLALALHVVMTVRSLRTAQPDVKRSGRFFSWAVIYLAGLLFTGGAALAATGGAGALIPFSKTLVREAWAAYAWSGSRFLQGLQMAYAWANAGWGA